MPRCTRNDWLTVSPISWLQDKTLQETRDYSKVHIGLNYDEKKKVLHCSIVGPKQCHDYIKQFIEVYDNRGYSQDTHLNIGTDWDLDFMYLATHGDDWDEQVNKISKKVKEHCDTVFRNVDTKEIKNLL